MYENKFQWARKIGFGFRPKDIIPENIDQWNKEQLNSDNQDIGLNGEGVWPESYNFSLEERLNRLHTFMTKKEKYDTNIFISFWNNQLPVSQPLNSISDLPEKRIKEEKASPNMDEPYYHKWMLYLCIIFIIILYLYSKNFLHIICTHTTQQ